MTTGRINQVARDERTSRHDPNQTIASATSDPNRTVTLDRPACDTRPDRCKRTRRPHPSGRTLLEQVYPRRSRAEHHTPRRGTTRSSRHGGLVASNEHRANGPKACPRGTTNQATTPSFPNAQPPRRVRLKPPSSHRTPAPKRHGVQTHRTIRAKRHTRPTKRTGGRTPKARCLQLPTTGPAIVRRTVETCPLGNRPVLKQTRARAPNVSTLGSTPVFSSALAPALAANTAHGLCAEPESSGAANHRSVNTAPHSTRTPSERSAHTCSRRPPS